MQTKHYLTAIHRGLSCAASAVINWFLYLQFFDYNESYKQGKALELICFIVILIGELIYCEVFIYNFCGLEVNTKKMIEARYTVEGEIEKKALQDLEQKTELEKKNSINDDDIIY